MTWEEYLEYFINTQVVEPHLLELLKRVQISQIIETEITYRMSLSSAHASRFSRSELFTKINVFEREGILEQDWLYLERIKLFCDIIGASFSSGRTQGEVVKLPNDQSRKDYFSQLIEPLIPYFKELSVKQLAWIFAQSASKSCRRYECIEKLQDIFFEKVKTYSLQELKEVGNNFTKLCSARVVGDFYTAFQRLQQQREEQFNMPHSNLLFLNRPIFAVTPKPNIKHVTENIVIQKETTPTYF